MSEHNWVTTGNPELILEFLRGGASERKLRLFACACCRSFWPLVHDVPAVAAGIEVAARYADDLTGTAALTRAHARLRDVRDRAYSVALINGMRPQDRDRLAALVCAALACDEHVQHSLLELVQRLPAWPDGLPTEAQVNLFRDVFENPFRRAPLPPAVLQWQEGTVGKLAAAAYEQRDLPAGTLDPAPLAVLADALEDAGADEAFVGHLRSGGPHVRGCWVLDRLLRRT